MQKSQSAMVVRFLIGLLVIGMTANGLRAEGRRFTYVHEVETEEPGELEYEQWVTWKTHKGSDSDFDRLDFRHEVQYGITENLQLEVILADWRYEDGESVHPDRAEYRASGFELIYRLIDPAEQPIGVALYGEASAGDQLALLEGKIILQHNHDNLVFAYNAGVEAEWEGSDYEEDTGEFSQSFGVSCEISEHLFVGVEALHEVEIEDWTDAGEEAVYVGPNASYRGEEDWWITLTPLFQVTDEDDVPDFQVRMIFGVEF